MAKIQKRKLITKRKGKKGSEYVQRSGRPLDDHIQVVFMPKIRGTKLQLFDAQSQLELVLATYGRSQRQIRASNMQEDDCEDLKDLIIQKLTRLSKFMKIDIMKKYQKIRQKWKFESVQDTNKFPEYLFVDGKDISFILYGWNKEGQKKKQLNVQEILLIQMLSLNDKKLLSRQILNTILKNQKIIRNLIRFGMAKAKQNLEQETTVENQDLEQFQENSQEQVNEENEEQNLICKLVNHIAWAYRYVMVQDISRPNTQHQFIQIEQKRQ